MEQGEMVGGAVDGAGDPDSVAALGAEATARAFARALLARDPRSAASWLAPDATLITPDGTAITGREQIAELLWQITASEQPLEIRAGRTVLHDDVALSSQHWRRGGKTGPDPHETVSTARLVLSRSSGRWKIVIASPWD
jgi:uncharacterized protein (TIGR02246 family)